MLHTLTKHTLLSLLLDMDITSKEKHHLELKNKLLSVTQDNTKLLKEIASLKEHQLKLNGDLKEASSYNKQKQKDSKLAHQNASERAKLLSLASRQEHEIQLLKLEIQSLKTKCGHVSAASSLVIM